MLISIVGVVIVISIVVLSHELGHFLIAKKMGVRVEVFSLGLGPKIWSFKRGETEYAISAIPIGGYVKMAGDELTGELKGEEWEFYSKPIYKRFNILVGGVAVNYIFGFMLFCAVFMIGGPVHTSRVGGILEGYPAEKAGLKENDKIIKIDGETVKYWGELTNAIYNKKEEEDIAIVVDRNGEVLTFTVKGKSEEQKDILGKSVRVTLIGITRSDEVDFIRHSFGKSIEMSARTVWSFTALTYRAIWGMLTGTLSLKMVSGPIGILAITGQAAKQGIASLLRITALINISLAIINLLPIPVLDGGHILFLGIEKLKGRPLDKRVQEVTQQVASILLITLMLYVCWNDILNLPNLFKLGMK